MNSAVVDQLHKKVLSLSDLNARQKEILLAWLEIALIIVFAMWIASPYLDTSTTLWPAGTGLGTKLLGNHFWPQMQQCGLCALWNGTQDGGRPALADVFGSQLHPLVVITTLLWGVVGGAKIAIIGILAMAGLAQWWLARLLKLGPVARLWSALIGVAGGNLATMNNEGNFGLMLATVTCSLAIAAVLALALNRRRQDTIVLALIGAMAIFAGQGYMQLALAAWAPALLFFWRRNDRQHSFYRELALAVGLAILIAAVLILPTAHFWPNFTKDTADPTFGFAEPLEYIPLNLVIRDRIFYGLSVVGRQPYTDLQFIGWIPVIFALISLRFVRRSNFVVLAFLASGAFLTYFVASAIPLRFLATYIPFLYGFRFTSPMPALAVPAVLALAAFGLDELWKLGFPSIELSASMAAKKSGISVSLKWLVVILLLVSVKQVADFTKSFVGPRDMSAIYQSMAALKTSQTEWVAPPGGETDWIEPAINSGLKVTNLIYSGSNWVGRDMPGPYLIAERNSQPPDSVLAGDLAKIPLYRIASNEYAFVQTPDGQISPCVAQATGGLISVECSAPQAGTLIVKENTYSGWSAWRDGARLPLLGGSWLSVPAPAGNHVYKFSYLPWDVGLGLLLTLAGVVACLVFLFRPRPANQAGTTEAKVLDDSSVQLTSPESAN